MTAELLTVSAADYHGDNVADRPTLSKSIIQILINASPAHAKHAHPKLNPAFERDDDPKFDLGNCAHSLFLEGLDKICVIPYDNWRTKAAQEQRDEARADGLVPLLPKQADEARAMVEALHAQVDAFAAAPGLFVDGSPERTIVWEEDGVLCRARLDWLHHDNAACDDLKTTSRTANPEAWCRSTLYSIGADVQAVFYMRGVQALTGKEPAFRFVVSETTPPYAISVVSLAPSAVELANAKVDRALAIWRECLATDTWPSYPSQVCYAEAPGWELSRWMEREARDEVAA